MSSRDGMSSRTVAPPSHCQTTSQRSQGRARSVFEQDDENANLSSDFQPIASKLPVIKKKLNKENINNGGRPVKRKPLFSSDTTFSSNDFEGADNHKTSSACMRASVAGVQATATVHATSVAEQLAGSSSGSGATRLCPGCDLPVLATTFTTHSTHCLQRFKYDKKPASVAPAAPTPATTSTDKSPTEVCPVCFKNIRHLADTGRQLHINRCIDSCDEEIADTDLPVADVVLDCPYCAYTSTSVVTRQQHVKKCAKRTGTAPDKLLHDLQLLERQKEERLTAGLFVPTARPRAAREPNRRRAAVVREPQTETVADMHMAKALSLSVFEEERKKRQLSELDEQSEEAFLNDGQTSDDPEAELIRALGINPTPPARSRKKKKGAGAANVNMALLLRTPEERAAIMADRVAELLLAQLVKPEPITLSTSRSSRDIATMVAIERRDRPVATPLWDLATCRHPDDVALHEYYVPGLGGDIGPDQRGPAAGSKLQHISQVPGYRIGGDSVETATTSSGVRGKHDNSTSVVCTQALLDLMEENAPESQCEDIVDDDNVYFGHGFISQYALPHSQGDDAPAIDYYGVDDDDDFVSVGLVTPLHNDSADEDVIFGVSSPATAQQADNHSPPASNESTTPPTMLVANLLAMVDVAATSDAVVVVQDGSRIPVHRTLLYANCRPVYDSLERRHDRVLEWSDISKCGALSFLRYAYTGVADHQPCPVGDELLRLAARYRLAELTRLVESAREPITKSSADSRGGGGAAGGNGAADDDVVGEAKSPIVSVVVESSDGGAKDLGVFSPFIMRAEVGATLTANSQLLTVSVPKKATASTTANSVSPFASLLSEVASLVATQLPATRATSSSHFEPCSRQLSACSSPSVELFQDDFIPSPDLFGSRSPSSTPTLSVNTSARRHSPIDSLAAGKSDVPRNAETNDLSTANKSQSRSATINIITTTTTTTTIATNKTIPSTPTTKQGSSSKCSNSASCESTKARSVEKKKNDGDSRASKKRSRNLSQTSAHDSTRATDVDCDSAPKKSQKHVTSDAVSRTNIKSERSSKARVADVHTTGGKNKIVDTTDLVEPAEKSSRASKTVAAGYISEICRYLDTTDESPLDSSTEYVPSCAKVIVSSTLRNRDNGSPALPSTDTLYYPEYVPTTRPVAGNRSGSFAPVYVPSPKKSITSPSSSGDKSSTAESPATFTPPTKPLAPDYHPTKKPVTPAALSPALPRISSRSSEKSNSKSGVVKSRSTPSSSSGTTNRTLDVSHSSRKSASRTRDCSPIATAPVIRSLFGESKKRARIDIDSTKSLTNQSKTSNDVSPIKFSHSSPVPSTSGSSKKSVSSAHRSREQMPDEASASKSSRPKRILIFDDDIDLSTAPVNCAELISSYTHRSSTESSLKRNGDRADAGHRPRGLSVEDLASTPAASANEKKRKHGQRTWCGEDGDDEEYNPVATKKYHRSDSSVMSERGQVSPRLTPRSLVSPTEEDVFRYSVEPGNDVWDNFDEGGCYDNNYDDDPYDDPYIPQSVPPYVPEITSTPKSSLSHSGNSGLSKSSGSGQLINGATRVTSAFVPDDSLPDLDPVPVYKPTKIDRQLVDETNTRDSKKSERSDVKRKTTVKKKSQLPKAKAVTPMLHYSIMPTPEVVNHLKKVGVRKHGKKAGVKILKHIYKETHPDPPSNNDSESDESQAGTTSSKSTQPLAQLESPVKLASSQRQVKGTAVGAAKPSAKPVAGAVEPHVLRKAIKEFIQNSDELIACALQFKPIDIALVHNHLKSNGIKCKIEEVKDVLDDEYCNF